MIRFDHPLLLVLCLFPLGYVLAGRFRAGSHRRGLALPLDIWGSRPTPDSPAVLRLLLVISHAGFLIAWLALSVAAAGPVRIEQSRPLQRSDADIMFVVDASPSMAAMDLNPTRLDAALEMVKGFMSDADGAGGASVGVVAFGAGAVLVCPPTPDHRIVLDRLGVFKPGMLGDGTAIGQGLATAYRHLSAGYGRRKFMVLLTDGEDNVGVVHPLDAASAFAAAGMGVLVLGLGSSGDAPIEYMDPTTGERLVGAYRSGFDDKALEAIAEAGRGSYLRATDAGAIGRALSRLGNASLQRTENASQLDASIRVPLGRFFAMAAAVAMALAWTIRRVILGGLA
ncbi:MAG: VWA domain-containing protein [Spirochaetia bacterium]|jgi:Ca-activated chloride channel family protein|nr:VWA domain-containing protein [Spirochaetia bacterium]